MQLETVSIALCFLLLIANRQIECASDHLKDVLIGLQTVIITQLRNVDDTMMDFSVLIDASDNARVKAVSTLCDLYLRMAVATRPQENLPPPRINVDPSPGLPAQVEPLISRQLPQIWKALPDLAQADHEYPPTKDNGLQTGIEVPIFAANLTQEIIETRGSLAKPQRLKPKRNLSSLLSWRSKSAISGSREENIHTPAIRETPTSTEHIALDSSSDLSRNPASTEVGDTIDDLDHNPWKDQSSIVNSMDLQSDATSRNALVSSRPSVQSPIAITLPSASNDYGGFCEGAFNLQVGTKKAMKLRSQMGPVQSQAYYFGCSSRKCAFEGEACKEKGDYVFDRTVRTSHGVRYRWSFLAKSHVTQGRVKNGIFNYRCMFCVLHSQQAPVLQKIDSLMQHISQHRTDHFGELVLHRTCCIMGRIAKNDEEFDINFPIVEDARNGSICHDTLVPDQDRDYWLK